MQIVDAQVHAWANGTSTGHHRRTPITQAVLEAEMAAAGVDRVVLVPPLWDPLGNTYSLSLARACPQRFSVMGVIDPNMPDPETTLEKWQGEPGLRGIRLLCNSPERLAPLQDGRFDKLLSLAEATGHTVAILAPGALSVIADIARRYPDLRMIVDHLGVPRGATGPAAFDHLPTLLALAEYPNLHVKAAGAGDYALDPYPFRSLAQPLQRIFDAYGAERVIWASDLSRLHHPYHQCVSHFCDTLPGLSSTELSAVMGGTICRLLGWEGG